MRRQNYRDRIPGVSAPREIESTHINPSWRGWGDYHGREVLLSAVVKSNGKPRVMLLHLELSEGRKAGQSTGET